MRVVFTAEFKIMQNVRELYINNRALVCFIFIIQKIHNFCYTHHSYINKMSTQKTAKNIYIHKNIKMKDFYRQTREEVYQHNLKHGGCRNMHAHVRRLGPKVMYYQDRRFSGGYGLADGPDLMISCSTKKTNQPNPLKHQGLGALGEVLPRQEG